MEEKNENLLERLFRLNMLLHRHRYHGGRGRVFGDPHRGQGRVMAILKLKTKISQKELSYLLGMRSQSLGELLSKLEKSGYITRVPSEEDKRALDIELTEAGIKAASAAQDAKAGADKLFDWLTKEEQEQFGGFLNKLIEGLESILGKDDIPLHCANFHGKHMDGDSETTETMPGRGGCLSRRRGGNRRGHCNDKE